MRLQLMTWPEVKSYLGRSKGVIVPIGSTEQHGNHLPINTDASDCFAIAQRAARAIDEFPVLVMPVIWTGYSPMHMSYPSTICTSRVQSLCGRQP